MHTLRALRCLRRREGAACVATSDKCLAGGCRRSATVTVRRVLDVLDQGLQAVRAGEARKAVGILEGYGAHEQQR